MKGLRLTSLSVIVAIFFHFQSSQAYNEDRGIYKWNPYWLSNPYSRYAVAAPPTYNYQGTGRGGKRLGDRGTSFGNQIYKWNPNYFSDGWFGRSMGASRYMNKFIEDRANDPYNRLQVNNDLIYK